MGVIRRLDNDTKIVVSKKDRRSGEFFLMKRGSYLAKVYAGNRAEEVANLLAEKLQELDWTQEDHKERQKQSKR